MKKIIKSLFLILLVLMITACSMIGSDGAKSSESPDSAISAIPSTPSTNKNEALETPSPLHKPPSVWEFQSGEIQGDIRNIYYSTDHNALLLADKLYLYNLVTGHVTSEAPREAFNQQMIWAIKGGYVAVGVKVTTGNNRNGWLTTGSEIAFDAVFYDHQLNRQSVFDFNILLKKDEHILSLKSFAFSNDGTQAAYATNTGLYLYNFNTKKKTTVVDLQVGDIATRSGIVAFEQIGFTNEDRTLAFKAKSLDIPPVDGKPSFDTGGTVNVDGSELFNRIFDNYTCKELTTYNHQLLLAEDFTIPSGRLLVMDIPGGKTKLLTLTEKGESGFVTGSDNGRYLATTLANNDKTGWKIRVYDTDTGKLQVEQYLSNGGESRYMANDPIVRVFDDERTYIVLLGATQPDIKPKIIIGKF
ncbi:WD40 repeat domain-containing protein [Paenibacillus sonchi]|uniref:transcriptional regulator n=1 Tax=Paenibacillus sonchi TaxID=373687 RepID=UPI001E2BC32B|nr:transcriptional regulator [Paenibacillus sonchi]MCE3202448.1 transcriptional regulator [Paenibacillus sonchi]